MSYSGGKDSDVMLRLAQMSGIKFTAIYKNTTIDPAGTVKHCTENGVITAKPTTNYFELISKAGFPTRWRRICCSKLKEYKICDVSLQGIRIEESKKRADRYKEPNYCRIYAKTKSQKANVWLPIRTWTTEDIKEFVESEHIQLHPLYYNEEGEFCPERRLGCIGCPLKSANKRKKELKSHPLFVKQYVRQIKKFRESKIQKLIAEGKVKTKEEVIEKIFKGIWDEYAFTVFHIFCSEDSNSIESFHSRFGNSLFGRTDCKKFLEDYFQIELP